MRHAQQEGFILVLTLLVSALAIILVSQFAARSSLHLYFDNSMIAREQAKNLALNGLNIAMCQLHLEREKQASKADAKKTEGQAQDKEQKKEPHLDFLERVLPLLNKLQTFKLTKEADGVDGTIQLIITSEDGKINIDQLFDYDKKNIIEIKQGQEITKKMLSFAWNGIQKSEGQPLFQQFITYMKQRDYPMDDITDLLEDPAINAQFKRSVFFEGQVNEKEPAQIFLTDLFTVWSDAPTIQPLLMSRSLKTIVGMKDGGKTPPKGEVAAALKGMKSQESSIKTMWDSYLKKLYGKDFSSISSEFEPFWSTKFEANTFSVLSYGIVNQVTQKVLVILKRTTSYTTKSDEFELIKIYWL